MCTEMHPVTRSIFITSRVLHLFHVCEKDRKTERINKLIESECKQSFQMIAFSQHFLEYPPKHLCIVAFVFPHVHHPEDEALGQKAFPPHPQTAGCHQGWCIDSCLLAKTIPSPLSPIKATGALKQVRTCQKWGMALPLIFIFNFLKVNSSWILVLYPSLVKVHLWHNTQNFRSTWLSF